MELTLSALLYLSAEVGGGCGEGRRNGDALTHRDAKLLNEKPLTLYMYLCIPVLVCE